MNFKGYSILFLLTIFVLSSCHYNKSNVEKRTKVQMITDSTVNEYKVFKIDSIKDVYMIYAIKSGKYYKIISDKTNSVNSNWKRIIHNVTYKLKLDTLASQKGVFEHMVGLTLDNGITVEFEGDSIRDLYSSPNVLGCYYNPMNKND